MISKKRQRSGKYQMREVLRSQKMTAGSISKRVHHRSIDVVAFCRFSFHNQYSFIRNALTTSLLTVLTVTTLRQSIILLVTNKLHRFHRSFSEACACKPNCVQRMCENIYICDVGNLVYSQVSRQGQKPVLIV